ncbi:MAG TPA: hypothetical protein VFQ65_09660 [Kofleriaceae bacterium]|nr:hypothetical protein [Kofleriaceae bacterium]
MLLVDGDKTTDVFELIELDDTVATVRSAFLFEIGEELKLRIEHAGDSRDVAARVRAHVANGATELELALA